MERRTDKERTEKKTQQMTGLKEPLVVRNEQRPGTSALIRDDEVEFRSAGELVHAVAGIV